MEERRRRDRGGADGLTGAASGVGVLGSVADGVDRPLDPRSITVRRIGGAITTATIAGGTLIALLVRLLAARPTQLEVGL